MSYGRARGLMGNAVCELINAYEKHSIEDGKATESSIFETVTLNGSELFTTIEFNDKRWRHGNMVILEKLDFSDIVSLVHYAQDELEDNKPNFDIKKVVAYIVCKKRKYVYECKLAIRYDGDGELVLHEYQKNIISDYIRYRDISHIEGGHLDIGIDEDKLKASLELCGLKGCKIDTTLKWEV